MYRIVLVVLLLVAIPSGWAAIHFGREKAVDELVAASQANDTAAFAARVDWEGLRAFLKKDLAKKKSNPMMGAMGPAKEQIDAVVDYYVRPENIDILFYYHDEVFDGIPEKTFILDTGFAPPFGFSLTVGMPQTDGKDPALEAARSNLKTRVVFRLDGLTWKVSELHVPLFMVPRHVYSTPAVEVYGRPKRN